MAQRPTRSGPTPRVRFAVSGRPVGGISPAWWRNHVHCRSRPPLPSPLSAHPLSPGRNPGRAGYGANPVSRGGGRRGTRRSCRPRSRRRRRPMSCSRCSLICARQSVSSVTSGAARRPSGRALAAGRSMSRADLPRALRPGGTGAAPLRLGPVSRSPPARIGGSWPPRGPRLERLLSPCPPRSPCPASADATLPKSVLAMMAGDRGDDDEDHRLDQEAGPDRAARRRGCR